MSWIAWLHVLQRLPLGCDSAPQISQEEGKTRRTRFSHRTIMTTEYSIKPRKSDKIPPYETLSARAIARHAFGSPQGSEAVETAHRRHLFDRPERAFQSARF